MEHSTSIFKTFWQKKNHTLKSIILCQLIFAIISSLIANIFFHQGFSPDLGDSNPIAAFLFQFGAYFLSYSFFAVFFYVAFSAIKTEKINTSQTWRLIPLSDGKIYLFNLFSSWLNLICLFIIQSLVLLFTMGIFTLLSSKVKDQVAKILSSEQVKDSLNISIANIVLFCLMIVFLFLAFYSLISLINLTTVTGLEFLPFKSTKFVKTVFRLVCIFLIIFIFNKLSFLFDLIGDNPWVFTDDSFASFAGIWIVDSLIFNVIVIAINVFLINHFVEAKANN